MRPSRILTIGILTITATLAAAVAGAAVPARAATTVNYVALGDSYSSGVGTGTESGSCGQSSQAYPALWAAANHPASFSFKACSGAKVPDVINSQLSTLSSSTSMVSFTIGGNDAGFSSIMETCVLSSTSTCESDISAAESKINATLPGELNTLIGDIKAHAPNAKVIVVGYPDFYDLSVSICIGLSRGDHQAIDAGINDLDGLLSTAAADNGATFADPRPAFSGHELCDGAGWLNSLDIFSINDSYHPTATGQADGYLPTFSAAATSVGQ
jgi:lysophospholipase L1-like esterase